MKPFVMWQERRGYISRLRALTGPLSLAASLGMITPLSADFTPIPGELLPTGARITPTVAPGAVFQPLNPDLPGRPHFVAGQAVATAVSPDGNTLLIVTSGYNRNSNPDGSFAAADSNEYVFVYDITGSAPAKRQVIQVSNTFNGIAWDPSGAKFYVSGGVNDNVHVYELNNGTWSENGSPIALGHMSQGIESGPVAAGVAVTSNGTQLLVANFENDSVSVVDLTQRTVIEDIDLRPGKIDPAQQGVPGGGYPFWIAIKGDAKAYVTSQCDREVVVLNLINRNVIGRIPVGGQPNKMILNQSQTRLYVANGNGDSVSVIDTSGDKVLEEIDTTAPQNVWGNPKDLKGSNPNSLVLSPDEKTLYVTNGGTNAVAVIQLKRDEDRSGPATSRVLGLIPTGWYPNSVSLSQDGSMLYVVNGKSNAGPNPGACRDTWSIAPGSLNPCRGRNEYVWQLTKAGFLALPLPSTQELVKLSKQVAANNNFKHQEGYQQDKTMMAFLQKRIKHVIYIVKENRTYDQVLGDLEIGNGDPSLALFPEPISPNHHALARQFVTLDNFYDSGEVSGDGWNWTTAARTTDFTEKTVAVNYGGRGLDYDWEGTNRNLNVGLATVAERQAANPLSPADPDLLPGAIDVATPDGPDGEAGTGYVWDAVQRKGLSVRNYGFYGDLLRYFLPSAHPAFIPIVPNPFALGQVQFYPSKAALQGVSDPYFRGYDMKNADFWLFKEWEREFDQYVEKGGLPALQFVRLPHDHFGDFSAAIDGVNTPDTQMADNDYAVGLLVEKVANSPYKNDTLIFVIEDDAQNGGDHVDAHRSIAYVVGPYVKQGALVSTPHNTVSMVSTMLAVLGAEPLGLTDGLMKPMSDVFEKTLRPWSYTALVPEVLRTTQLPLPTRTAKNSLPLTERVLAFATPRGDAAYWARVMTGQQFAGEDKLDEPRFNLALWRGLMGEHKPYPTERHGSDLSTNRAVFLEKFWRERLTQMTLAQAERK